MFSMDLSNYWDVSSQMKESRRKIIDLLSGFEERSNLQTVCLIFLCCIYFYYETFDTKLQILLFPSSTVV